MGGKVYPNSFTNISTSLIQTTIYSTFIYIISLTTNKPPSHSHPFPSKYILIRRHPFAPFYYFHCPNLNIQSNQNKKTSKYTSSYQFYRILKKTISAIIYLPRFDETRTDTPHRQRNHLY